MKKTFFKLAGYLAVALAFAGAFIPLLPTTPFLLLAVYCFSKGDARMNRWLLHNRLFGKYLRDYEEGRGIPLAVKITAMITMWSSILFTSIVLIDRMWIRMILFALSLFISVHILKLKTIRHDTEKDVAASPDVH